MNLLKVKNKFLLLIIFFSAVASSDSNSITVMSFNVENLFDAKDNPIKRDDTYLPISKKSSEKHIENCQKIRVKKWRDDCLYLDWNQSLIITSCRLSTIIIPISLEVTPVWKFLW